MGKLDKGGNIGGTTKTFRKAKWKPTTEGALFLSLLFVCLFFFISAFYTPFSASPGHPSPSTQSFSSPLIPYSSERVDPPTHLNIPQPWHTKSLWD